MCYIVSLKTKAEDYSLYVEAYIEANGKSYLRHTAKTCGAKRFSESEAMQLVGKLKTIHCIEKIEEVPRTDETI